MPPMDDALALYVHWPFCKSKCPYCDFNSHETHRIDQPRWRDALIRELEYYASETNGRPVTSLFFGGGTPSLMDPGTTGAIIEAAHRLWPVAADAEITLEANPTSSEAANFTAFREAGVNRLSLGVQSLHDDALAFLGRTHGAEEAKRAIELAAANFPRFSFDLIYARPGQTEAGWRTELAEALEFSPSHLSVYQLTIEPGTPFAARGVPSAEDEIGGALYETTQQVLSAAGLPVYEISNHARPGQESRHNLTYWRGLDYIGIGPGAHGRLSANGVTQATRQIRDPARWLAAVESRGQATAARTTLSPRERADEMIMLGLRTIEGVDWGRLARRTGLSPEEAVNATARADLAEAGFIGETKGALRATTEGRQRLNAVIAKLLS